MLDLVPVGLLFLVMLFVFFPILTGGTYLISGVTQNDQWLFNYPLKEFYRTQLINGKLPLWTSLIGNGYPIFAEGQVGALYPFHLILFKLFSTLMAYNLNIIVHFVMASIFTYLYVRNLGLSKKASFLSGLVYSLSGFMTIHIHQVNINMVITYLPLAMMAIDKIILRKFLWFSILTAVFTLQILAGHIEMFYYCLGISGLYLLLRNFVFRPTEIEAGKNDNKSYKTYGTNMTNILTPMVVFSVSILLSLGITFIQTSATFELNKLSQRSEGINIEHATATVWPIATLGLFINPRQYELYRVEKDYVPTGNYTVNIHALYGYIGIVPLMLALFALVLNRKKTTLLFGALMFLAFFYGLGRSTQLFTIFWNLIPGLKFFRFPTKILFLIELCLAVLAGIGLDTLNLKFKINNLKLVRVSGYLIIGISLADLLYFNAFGTRKIINANNWLAKPESVQILSEKIGDPYIYRIYGHGMSNIDYSWATNYEQQMVFRNMLPIDFNMIYKIPTNQEWAVLFLDRQSKLNSEKTKIDVVKGIITLTSLHKKALAMQSVRYVVSDVEIVDADLTEIKLIPFLTQVNHVFYVNTGDETAQMNFPVSGVHIYENKYYYPRASFVSSYKMSDAADQSLRLVMDEEFDAGKEVVLETTTEKLKDRKTEKQGSKEEIEINDKTNKTYATYIEKDDQDNMEIKVGAENDGFLVLNDTYYPGWKAWVDGVETEILRANYAFRGVYIEKGEHNVIMKYEPTYWKVGKRISLGSLGVFVVVSSGIIVLERRKKVTK